MVPGALLGLALCLGSGRLDWYRRSAVVGLFAAVGWAWGGSISYMEHTFYIQSDSFPDVLYGYAAIFFIGALWAGCGGAILGLSLTQPRSELERFARPFAVVGTVFLAIYLCFLFMPEQREAYNTLTVLHFHDGDWLSATLFLVISAIYWVVVPKDRKETALLFWAAVAWWIGYGLLTKIGGLRLAPMHRSESWGGVLGVLVALTVYLYRKQNRAALMLCLYGVVGGGLAYVLAVFIHHPWILRWGPFANNKSPIWSFAEGAFGFFMGIALALGALRLIRGGLAAPDEDTNRATLDVFAVFVMLVALPWMNFRRHAVRLIRSMDGLGEAEYLGLGLGGWYLLFFAILTTPLLYCLYRYLRGDRQLAPQSSFGKGLVIALVLMWMTIVGQFFDMYPTRAALGWNLIRWIPALMATCLFVGFSGSSNRAVEVSGKGVSASDSRWRLGIPFVIVSLLSPVFILGTATLSVSMQDDSYSTHGRKRFGPEAYWRQTARLHGTWASVGFAKSLGDPPAEADGLPLASLSFDPYRNVTATLVSGEEEKLHRWFLKNQYTWLRWYGKAGDHPERAETPLQFEENRLYITWPPHTGSEGYLVLERPE